MEFTVAKNILQKELGFVQGIVERKNTIPALSNILLESEDQRSVRVTGTDLDVTIRCTMAADIRSSGAICVNARKLFEIARVLPDADVHFRKEENNWVAVKCQQSSFRIAGVDRDSFPEVPAAKSTTAKLPASVFKTFIDRTIFAITLEESRYTLSGAKFVIDDGGARMVTTDGHRLAYINRQDAGKVSPKEKVDTLIPRKTLAELTKLTSGFDGDISFGADDNHIYFEIGERTLTSRLLAGQFPNYEMVMPKNNDKSVTFDGALLNQAVRRVALMADDRSHAVKFKLATNNLQISSQTAEEGEAKENLETVYAGVETEIGFNAAYLQDFLNVVGEEAVAFEFKDSNTQTQLRPVSEGDYDYRYVVMPMRL